MFDHHKIVSLSLRWWGNLCVSTGPGDDDRHVIENDMYSTSVVCPRHTIYIETIE